MCGAVVGSLTEPHPFSEGSLDATAPLIHIAGVLSPAWGVGIETMAKGPVTLLIGA